MQAVSCFLHVTVEFLSVGFPVGVDLFPYTREEFRNLPKTSPGWFETIDNGKRIL